jgi:hypothetical protein
MDGGIKTIGAGGGGQAQKSPGRLVDPNLVAADERVRGRVWNIAITIGVIATGRTGLNSTLLRF